VHWLDSRRRKKLILAFHFLSSSDGVWNCEDCRARGWERARRCGFLQIEANDDGRPVWSRNGVEARSCPKTEISATSTALVDEFRLWSACGRKVDESIPTLQWQAFGILLREERRMREHAW